MKVHQIDTTNPRQVKEFIELPFKIYKDCPQWVPPLNSEIKLALNKNKHPFYQHSDADFFMVKNNNETLGRIAVLHNRNYCDYKGTQTAFFYYYETVKDIEVSRALFSAACDWARSRNLNTILGPKGFLRSSGMGLLVDGFEYLPALGIPYNHAYYADFIEDWGFQKSLDQYSGYQKASTIQLDPRLYQIAEKVKQRGNFWVKTFKNKAEMQACIPEVNKVQAEAFADNPNYFPSTQAEFDMIANSMIQIADPRMIKLIMKGDNVAGFIISYPDISRALQQTRGKLYPFGWLKILREKKNSRVVVGNGIGILPQYQGLGANALLYVEMEKMMRDLNYEHAEIVQVNENNFKSRADWEKLDIKIHKTHRTYIYHLDE